MCLPVKRWRLQTAVVVGILIVGRSVAVTICCQLSVLSPLPPFFLCFVFCAQLEIAKERRDDVTVQGSAYAALAAAHQKLGAVDEAVECLQKFLAVGQDTDNRKMQVSVCASMCNPARCLLGEAYPLLWHM